MENPWQRLPQSPPYVLSEDISFIERHNDRVGQAQTVLTDWLTEPFQGCLEAPIVLLNGNPRFRESIAAALESEQYKAAARRNLWHAPSEYPLFLTDPVLKKIGFEWWSKKLNPLLRLFDRRTVAKSFLNVEYFPYRSRDFPHLRAPIPSQVYSFHLVTEAMERSALIICMRHKAEWFEAIPSLATYQQLHFLGSCQNVTIGPGNCPSGFDKIVDILSNRSRAA